MRSSNNLESHRDDELCVGREGHEEGPDLVALEEDSQRQRYGSKADLAFIQSGKTEFDSSSFLHLLYELLIRRISKLPKKFGNEHHMIHVLNYHAVNFKTHFQLLVSVIGLI